MKTLKQLRKIQEAGADDYVVDPDDDEEALEYQPRSDGEIEFVDLHSVEVSDHPAAPEDQHVAKTSHNKHKGAEHPGEPVVKQGTSGDVKFAKFREKITKTPLRKGDKRQGDFKAGSVKEEVELDEDMNEAVEVSHDRYMRSHGKKAKGDGMWMFTHKRMGDVDHKDMFHVSGKFADAAKAAKAWAKKNGHSTVYVMEEVELDEAEQVVTLPKGVGFYDTTNYPIGGKFDRVTDSNGLKVTVKRRFKLYKGTDTEGMTSDGKKVAFQMRLAKEEVEFIEEAVKAGTIKLENGKSVKVTKEDADAFNAVLKELNPENRKRMESEMMKDEKSYKNMLTFAKRTM